MRVASECSCTRLLLLSDGVRSGGIQMARASLLEHISQNLKSSSTWPGSSSHHAPLIALDKVCCIASPPQLLAALGSMSKRQNNREHGGAAAARAAMCDGASDSSDEHESFASAEEKIVRRYCRHAFTDLVVPAQSTCAGYVDLSTGVVWIAKLCGKVISQQSLRARDGCRTLPLIDSLYAVERGALVTRVAAAGASVQALCAQGDVDNGVLVSIQDMWCMAMNSGIGVEQYAVYRSLRDHGYTVFPHAASHGARAVMHAVKGGSSTTVLVFSVRDAPDVLMRCLALLPGAQLQCLRVQPAAAAEDGESKAAVNGCILTMRSACAAAVVDGTDVTWLGFDAFQ